MCNQTKITSGMYVHWSGDTMAGPDAIWLVAARHTRDDKVWLIKRHHSMGESGDWVAENELTPAYSDGTCCAHVERHLCDSHPRSHASLKNVLKPNPAYCENALVKFRPGKGMSVEHVYRIVRRDGGNISLVHANKTKAADDRFHAHISEIVLVHVPEPVGGDFVINDYVHTSDPKVRSIRPDLVYQIIDIDSMHAQLRCVHSSATPIVRISTLSRVHVSGSCCSRLDLHERGPMFDQQHTAYGSLLPYDTYDNQIQKKNPPKEIDMTQEQQSALAADNWRLFFALEAKLVHAKTDLRLKERTNLLADDDLKMSWLVLNEHVKITPELTPAALSQALNTENEKFYAYQARVRAEGDRLANVLRTEFEKCERNLMLCADRAEAPKLLETLTSFNTQFDIK